MEFWRIPLRRNGSYGIPQIGEFLARDDAFLEVRSNCHLPPSLLPKCSYPPYDAS